MIFNKLATIPPSFLLVPRNTYKVLKRVRIHVCCVQEEVFTARELLGIRQVMDWTSMESKSKTDFRC